MAINLLGFTIERQKKPESTSQSFVAPVSDDGATTVSAAGYYGTFVDIDASSRSESELISRYREISSYPDCDNAIEEIVSEAISSVEDEKPVILNLDKVNLINNIKKQIESEFNNILELLDFNDKAHDIFRRWYIDGRLYYQKIIDEKNVTEGIQELRYIDPRKIRKVRNVKKERKKSGIEIVKDIDEFFIYNEKGISYSPGVGPTPNNNSGIRISPDSITFCPSGVLDYDRNIVLGYMHKAIKPVNQLKMMADSLVIYRLARAPERRIFYIDVGNLPKVKAEQYMKDIMTRYRNKIVYDSNTGEVKDDRKFKTMLEDFWLPRREGGRGTEISTLPGGENLGQIADIEFFQTKVYQSLNIPTSRFESQSGFNFGRAAEITHEEMKFMKFIYRIRKKFNVMFNDLLKTQLLLKGIIVNSDWTNIKEQINYVYAEDQKFRQIKELENLRNQADVLTQIIAFVGNYFSVDYVRRNILKMTDEEIEKIDQQNQDNPPQSEVEQQ